MPQQNNSTFMPLVPSGWIREYLEAMVEARNEMPLVFHFMAGATVIGNMIGLRAWATLAKGVRIYPNINALLLSPAGKCRRGEGTKITTAIARKAGVNLYAGKITPEGLADELMENGNLVLYVEELSMLLTKQDFMLPIIPLLTKLLLHGDGPSEVRTRAMGERRRIPSVNLSALFTSAPDWFMTTIPDEAYGGGMMSRFLVCCLDDREVYHVDLQADDKGDAMVDSLASSLRPVRDVLKGHIRGTDGAQKWMAEWYHENETRDVEDERMAPHRNRKPANLVRLAMLLGASAGVAEMDQRRLEQALKILDWIEPTLVKLYGLTEEVVNVMAGGEKRIITKLAAGGGTLQHSSLVRSSASYFKGGVQEMRRCLDGMLEKGILEAHYRNGVKMWPPVAWKIVNGEDK